MIDLDGRMQFCLSRGGLYGVSQRRERTVLPTLRLVKHGNWPSIGWPIDGIWLVICSCSTARKYADKKIRFQ